MEFYESYMKFHFADEDLYRIEESELQRSLKGVKTCECVAKMNGRIALVEAKSSAPRPDNKMDFDAFTDSIMQKFVDTLLLFNAVKLQRHGDSPLDELGSNVKALRGDEDYVLYLIIHGHKEEWLMHMMEALQLKLNHFFTLWHILPTALKAINQEEAKRIGLIDDFFPLERLTQLKASKSPMEIEKEAREYLSL